MGRFGNNNFEVTEYRNVFMVVGWYLEDLRLYPWFIT